MIRRTQSLADTMHCSKLKDLYYFKQLLKNYDIALIKQFLQENIQVVIVGMGSEYVFQEEYRYVAGGCWEVRVAGEDDVVALKLGWPVQNCQGIVADQEVKFYRIALKAENVLKKLNHLNLPILSRLKSYEKLNFLMKCSHTFLNFGTFIYRKGEPATSIFLVVSGEVKIMSKKNEKIVDLGTISKDRMFGIYCLKHGKIFRQLSAKSNQNGTQILQLPKQQLELICEQKQISLPKLLESIKSQLFSMNKFWAVPIRKSIDLQQTRKNQLTFSSRIKQFHKQRCIKNKHLEDIIQTKTLVFKVKDLNLIRRRNEKGSASGNRKYAFDVSKESRRKNRIDTCSSATSTPKQGNFCSTSLRSFVGLTRSPSVRNFMSRMSRRS